jgi:hypothetical protein
VSSGWLGGARSSPDLHGKGIGDPFELHVGPRQGPRRPECRACLLWPHDQTRMSLVHLRTARSADGGLSDLVDDLAPAMLTKLEPQ